MGPAGTVENVEAEHHGGRPLDASRDDALRQAALALLAEVGYDRLTMDAVAARAKAGKTTIYRRWSGKAELIVDALKSAQDLREPPNTGSLSSDLEVIAETIASVDSRFDAQVAIGLITAVARDAELRRVFQERLLEPKLASIRQVLELAVVRGEISNDCDLDLLSLLLPALSLYRLVAVGEMPEAGFAQRIMEEVILPLATAPSKDTPPPISLPKRHENDCRS